MNAFDPDHTFDTGQRIYTDERYPDISVVNSGGPHFEVYQRMPSGDAQPIDEFTGYEVPGADEVSEEFAHRRARSYFNELANSTIPDAMDYEEEEKPEHPSTQDVDDIIAQARAEADPAKAEELKKQALRLMNFESVAEALVEHALAQ